MINNIYFDLDECLLHTVVNRDPDQACFVHTHYGATYHTIIRPCAKQLFSFAQSLVGKKCVYILTASTFDYASGINNHYGFVNSSNLLCREDLKEGIALGVYVPHHTANKNNVLIDNLSPRYNESKTIFVGITDYRRYLQTPEYYGVDFPNDPFEADVQSFLINLSI